MGYLPGDCLIAAAFMSYMGPFLSEYREQMVQKIWLAEVITRCLIQDDYTIQTFCLLEMKNCI